MKKVLAVILSLMIMFSIVPLIQAETTETLCLDGEWDFKYYQDAGMVPDDVTSVDFTDKIQVPGAMEVQGYGYPGYYFEEEMGWGAAEDDGVRSAGVYKTTVNFSYDKEIFLKFESVRDHLKVFVNGQFAGESNNGAIGSIFKVNLKKGENTIIVVVLRDKSGINKEDNFALSGIVRSVYVTESVTVEQAGKTVYVKDNTLYVDGEEVVLRGVKYTPVNPETLFALTNSQINMDLLLIKQLGFNALWTSCAPDYLYERCEKLGIYVIDEANVYLGNVDRDAENAKKRVEEMVERHFGYSSIIMWSEGAGNGNNPELANAIKELDSRPVAQEVNFAPEFEMFGNTGGQAEWVNALGQGNVGGFVDEFKDKEIYYTKNLYDFTVGDTVTGENVNIVGEIANYKGADMLGKGSYERNVGALDRFTVLSYISNANKDRVIFETADKNIRLETVNYRIRLTVNGQSIDADGGEGKVAAVYADGEMQLFTSRSFKSNMLCNTSLSGNYTVGEGNGGVAIKYVKIYNDILTIDELIELSAEDKCVSSVEFDNINVNQDMSYKFLAYGGDFGDEPNSYYKCLTGIVSSEGVPYPEAYEFKALLNGKAGNDKVTWVGGAVSENKITPVKTEEGFVFTSGLVTAVVNDEGAITSIVSDDKELLTSKMYPTIIRENTISEIEMGRQQEEKWTKNKCVTEDNVLYIELISSVTDGRLYLAYSMTDDSVLTVSVQSQFGENATKPEFVGFRGEGDYTEAAWFGTEYGTYPDRRSNISLTRNEKSIDAMTDGYAVPQENGNYYAEYFTLKNTEKNMTITFSSEQGLECQVHNYSPIALAAADHDEDIVKENKAYFRIGGYISGVSDNRNYQLNDNEYGYTFCIAPGAKGYDNSINVTVDNERYKAFSNGVYKYVYRTNEPVVVKCEDMEVVQNEKMAVFGDYTIFFEPDNAYLSELEEENKTAEIAKDVDFNGNAITMRGRDYWSPSVTYDKGISLKNGSVTYNVSDFNSHTFNAVIGKADMDWRSMGGGFDRNMFQASCDMTISLDGKVVAEIKDISMRSSSQEVNIDISDAKTMTITVAGKGTAPQYEDAVVANAALIPRGPVIVNFEKTDGKAYLTVLNTDKENCDVMLSSEENGIYNTVSTRIAKGLYRTLCVDAGEKSHVSAVVTGLGTIELK